MFTFHKLTFDEFLVSLKSIGDDIKRVEDELEKSETPFTPARFPEWNKFNLQNKLTFQNEYNIRFLVRDFNLISGMYFLQ